MKIKIPFVETQNTEKEGRTRVGSRGGCCALFRRAEMMVPVERPAVGRCPQATRRPEPADGGTEIRAGCTDRTATLQVQPSDCNHIKLKLRPLQELTIQYIFSGV